MSRPPRPAAVSRQLRQEAGFGCCRCGLPIYQYHHIVPYHADDPYPAHEMMILCPLCHDLATKGALPVEDQWAHKATPHNATAGLVEGQLIVNQSYCAVAVGGTIIVGEGATISVDERPLLGLEVMRPGRTLAISVELRDESDQVLAVIESNEWISGDPLPWDIESDHQRLVIRRKERAIALDIDARSEPVEIRAELWWQGERVQLSPNGVRFGTAGEGGIVDLGLVGMSLHLDSQAGEVRIIPDPRFGQGMLVSRANPTERLEESVAAWERLVARREKETGRNNMCWCGSEIKLKRCHGA